MRRETVLQALEALGVVSIAVGAGMLELALAPLILGAYLAYVANSFDVSQK